MWRRILTMRTITRRLKRFGEVEDSVDLLIKNLSHLSLSNMEVPDIKTYRRFFQLVIVAAIN